MATKLDNIGKVRGHQVYRLADGTIVPGATTVTGVLNKPALIRWANQQGLAGVDTSRYVSKVADAGTLAHEMAAAHWAGETADTDAYSREQIVLAESSFRSYLAWERQHDVEIHAIERQYVSERHRYGGTIDAIADVDGVQTVLDLKTSKAIYDEHLYQVAGYWALALENDWDDVSAIRVVQIGRGEGDGWTERVLVGTDILPYWDVFQACLGLYRAIQAVKGR
jgi:hypothetical protein